jgi:hypothetical protein
MLSIWLDVVFASFGLAPGDQCAVCLTVLLLLADATRLVRVMNVLDGVALDCNPEQDEIDEDETAHPIETILGLYRLGAVSINAIDDPDKAKAELTPLGRMLADTVFTALTIPADMIVDDIVERIGRVTPTIADKITAPWLAGRSTPEAAAELLDFASWARADLRTVATAFVVKLGDLAAPAWQDRVSDRGVGVYARAWLAEHGQPGMLKPGDEEWMAIEELSAGLAAMPEAMKGLAFSGLVEEAGPEGVKEMQRLLNRSKHPDAARLAVTFSRALGMPARPVRRLAPVVSVATGVMHRLHVSLRHVQDPPVWRIIAVDGGTTLADLHLIIQAAMGWDDDHRHRFERGLQDLDEAVAVGEVLGRGGSRLLYVYDFGDDWEHDILVEEVKPNAEGLPLPDLLSGGGACPPEDCGGAPGYWHLKDAVANPDNPEHPDILECAGDGFDPVRFSVEDMRVGVRRCGSLMTSARTPAKAIRIQPRRKGKRR